MRKRIKNKNERIKHKIDFNYCMMWHGMMDIEIAFNNIKGFEEVKEWIEDAENNINIIKNTIQKLGNISSEL